MTEVNSRARQAAASDSGGARAKVISIDAHSKKRAYAQPPVDPARPVTQVRLAEGLQLHLEEMRIIRARREFRLRLEADLAAGAQIEEGDLLYDPELKIVRRDVRKAIVRG